MGHPEEHCCHHKMVGEHKYHLVDYQAWRKAKKEKGFKLPDICHSGCVYEMEGSDTDDLYCFKRGRLESQCYDDDDHDHEGSGYGYGDGDGEDNHVGRGMKKREAVIMERKATESLKLQASALAAQRR